MDARPREARVGVAFELQIPSHQVGFWDCGVGEQERAQAQTGDDVGSGEPLVGGFLPRVVRENWLGRVEEEGVPKSVFGDVFELLPPVFCKEDVVFEYEGVV